MRRERFLHRYLRPRLARLSRPARLEGGHLVRLGIMSKAGISSRAALRRALRSSTRSFASAARRAIAASLRRGLLGRALLGYELVALLLLLLVLPPPVEVGIAGVGGAAAGGARRRGALSVEPQRPASSGSFSPRAAVGACFVSPPGRRPSRSLGHHVERASVARGAHRRALKLSDWLPRWRPAMPRRRRRRLLGRVLGE